MEIYIVKKNKYKTWFNLLQEIVFKHHNVLIKHADIRVRKNGKPYFCRYNLCFSVSHSRNYLCIGVSNKRIGIDIEESRKISNKQIQLFIDKSEKIINNDVMNNWCIKEAYSKYIGLGQKMNYKKIQLKKIKENVKIINLTTSEYYCYVVCNDKIDYINR